MFSGGEFRTRTFIHPDSIGVRVWVAEQLVESTGKYAKPGDTWWKDISDGEPTTSRAVVEMLVIAEAKEYARANGSARVSMVDEKGQFAGGCVFAFTKNNC